MQKKNTGPFSSSPKQVAVAVLISAALHAAFVLSCADIHFPPHSKVAHTAKKLPSPCMYEPIPAAKQRALTETLNRFFPFIATPGYKKKQGNFGAPAKESSPELFAIREARGEALGEDPLTLVNFDQEGPELPAISNRETESETSSGVSFPFEAPLNLDAADIIREIETPEIDTSLNSGQLSQEGPSIASSTLLLSDPPTSEPFEIETNRLIFERESLSLNRQANLFEKGGEKGLALPTVTKEKETSADLPPLPHLQIRAEELMPTQKKGEFGEIISDHFTCKTTSFQIKDQALFFFRVELEPTSIAHFQFLDNELIFLIDRSHSIDPSIFKQFKGAVSHALGLLPKSCRFNVGLFDKNITFFADESLPASRSELIRAKTFLIGQDHGGLFAATDLFKALTSLKASNSSVTSALILTDGDTFLSSSERRDELLHFIKNREAKISLFAAATGSSNNLELLDEVAAFCRGKLIYEKEPIVLQKRLATLVRSLATPIAKDIRFVVQKEEGREIFFHTPTHRLPILYGRGPYVLYGTTNKPGEITLFIQGQGARGPITIKKKITVEKNPRASTDILEAMKGIERINALETTLKKQMHEPLAN